MEKQRYSIALVVAVALAVFVVTPTESEAARKAARKYVPRRMDGVAEASNRANFWPVAVMIDNHTDARPQSGLQAASFVYETLAEGGIPRFMAVYADANVARMGPVRSSRPYFVNYASEWGAALAHAGGSPDSFKQIQKLRLVSIFALQGKTAKYFYRAFGGGVHGLYTASSKLVSAMKVFRVWYHKPNYTPYNFKDDASVAKRGRANSGTYIDLGYGQSYDIEYRYSPRRNAYLRRTGGRPQMDRLTGKQVAVRNVIILNVPKEKVLDRKGRLELKTIGRGTGIILQNGKATKIIWSKKSPRAKTIFKTLDGKIVSLLRGNTWVTVVPKGHKYRLL